ncbi:ABC transporter substrate-binding protein [Methylobacterium frigidaeris]|uniref:ABC transporter substrate-binding protein n=1 Tax=Methylobacterium frigidaeris TaxID=2038277 RepID=A0AA37M7X2_9HYPH|nr:ABC transporter substrate binding protein [Methylobacterium frigidaeris]GJD65557.1 hypothetical protein MPEAHAMD_5752 [Methylobacterium frigidaeris]
MHHNQIVSFLGEDLTIREGLWSAGLWPAGHGILFTSAGAARRHMLKSTLLATAAVLCLGITHPSPAIALPDQQLAANAATWPVTPKLKEDGTKWRIGYYEGGQYADYVVILKSIVNGLAALGWLKGVDIPAGLDPFQTWQWLATRVDSRFIEFVADARYAPGNFDASKRTKTRAELIGRLKERRDLDLVLALGTWAGQDLATSEVTVPVIVASTSDPVGSKIVASAEDSGFDHLNAKVEPTRYHDQVELFWNTFGFKRLGVVYEDSTEGRSFAALPAVEAAARELGFEVVGCKAPFSNTAQAVVDQAAIACYRDLAVKADAVYVTVHRGVNAATLPAISQALITGRIPSFSMLGETEVRAGVLMSVAQSNYLYVGRFHAETIARIFNGARPRSLPQIWQAPAQIALNYTTAKAIGYVPPFDILVASDEIVRSPATTP